LTISFYTAIMNVTEEKMVTIPLKVSDDLAGRLLPLQDRLPEIIELGLRQIKAQADADAKAGLSTSRARALAALASTGIVTLPRPATRLQARIRHTPIQAGGQPASEIIIEARGVR
jgi:hypothetical protein